MAEVLGKGTGFILLVLDVRKSLFWHMDGWFHLTATVANEKVQTDKIQLKKARPQRFTKQAETCARTSAEVFARFWSAPFCFGSA